MDMVPIQRVSPVILDLEAQSTLVKTRNNMDFMEGIYQVDKLELRLVELV